MGSVCANSSQIEYESTDITPQELNDDLDIPNIAYTVLSDDAECKQIQSSNISIVKYKGVDDTDTMTHLYSNIVFGFINQIQNILINDTIIPIEIYHLCCYYYLTETHDEMYIILRNHSSNPDYFELCCLSFKNKTIRKKKCQILQSIDKQINVYGLKTCFAQNINVSKFSTHSQIQTHSLYNSTIRVLGNNNDNISLTKCEMFIYDNEMNLYYQQLPSIPVSVSISGIVFNEHTLYVVGGRDRGKSIYSLNFDPNDNNKEWKEYKNVLKEGRSNPVVNVIDHNKLIIINGVHLNVEIYNLDTMKSKNIASTQNNYTGGSSCREIGFDPNRIAVHRDQNVEIYDYYKNRWTLYPVYTHFVHLERLIWTGTIDKNIMYIGGMNSQQRPFLNFGAVEWTDIRQGKRWNVIQETQDILGLLGYHWGGWNWGDPERHQILSCAI